MSRQTEGPLNMPPIARCKQSMVLLVVSLFLLGCVILTHDRLNMSNQTLRHLAIMSIKWRKSGNVRRRSSNMTTHEMILSCSSLQGVRRCIPLCLGLGFATFAVFGKFGYPPSTV